jgi:hypothetical protein
MALSRLRANRFAPWAGLVASTLGAALNQQLLGDMLRFECRLGQPATGLLVGGVVFALMAAGAWVSWASVHGTGRHAAHQATRLFIARLSLMLTALLAIMVAWQVLATFMVPPCPA